MLYSKSKHLKKINKSVLLILSTFLSLSSYSFIYSPVQAQTVDERIEKLEQELRLVELENKIITERKNAAEARKAIAETAFPDIDSSKAPSGTISVEEVKIEPTLLAYEALGLVAADIQKEITENLGENLSIIVFSNSEIATGALDILAEDSFTDRVASTITAYGDLEVFPQDSPGIVAAAGFLFELLPFFRSNKTFKGLDVSLDERALITQLVAKFTKAKQNNISVYYPKEFPLVSKPAIDSIVNDVQTLKKLQSQSKERIKSGNFKPQEDSLKKLNDEVDSIIEEITKVEANSVPKTFESIARARTLKSLGASKKTVYLSVKIVGGGTNKTVQNFLSSRLRHSGGAIVDYIVYDQNLASILLANNHRAYTGFTKIPDINKQKKP